MYKAHEYKRFIQLGMNDSDTIDMYRENIILQHIARQTVKDILNRLIGNVTGVSVNYDFDNDTKCPCNFIIKDNITNRTYFVE